MTQTALITGSNRGIGLELCRQLQAQGFSVIATCRQASSALNALDVEVISDVDVSDPASLKTLSNTLGDRKIDWLINNAGIAGGLGLNDIDVNTLENFKRMYEVNSLGPLVTTQILRKHLQSGSKVGLITSRMGSIADNDSGGSYAYRMSKAALNAAGKSLSLDLKSDGIAVAILHPGWVRTDMTGHGGLVDADESASGLIARMTDLTLNNTGTFWHMNGEILPW
ncbi:3-oxoacyl-(acyl-carrier protein) reductase [Methylophaga frappieri]|jgi:NAD(P)-dependent dehydrogenase (short-subunit alcohol dehydrogenase family)|uniref:3-oxoacyl-(Acyl-carrier protein) reductase n=1 Tax=Methylophaga frappieri (strain ATCC BAA-2434 / DSM 25690 / JAM7) TaxID=754477 RepID=I1YGV8_METFJ|nr:SDR family oxidoreductase [Methylophaga frappieri]AFJ02151.1 3-oxoacyl-(acyl-carrier protein) reductase [Methylophaga frappieri]